jgi:hypothetical protein
MSTISDSDEILLRLFGSVSRARILEFLVSQAGRAFYQREIMYGTGLSLQPTQRELKCKKVKKGSDLFSQGTRTEETKTV